MNRPPANLPANPLEGGLSIVVLAIARPAGLRATLDSVAMQTLDHSGLEVVVVVAGQASGNDLVHEFRQSHPDLEIRVIGLPVADDAAARRAGLAGARRTHLTLMEAGDTISEGFAETLLSSASAQATTSAVACAKVEPVGAMLSDAGKLVATDLARAATMRLDGTEDVFWARIASQSEFLHEVSDSAVYRHEQGPDRPPAGGDFDAVVPPHLEAITALEELRSEAGASQLALIDEAVAARATAIGLYLERHPDDHERLVSALDSRPIFQLPYGRVNEGMARGLVFAYAFAPYADASAVVMAKRLRSTGQVADVIYNAMDRIREVDNTTRRIAGPFIADEAALATPTYFSNWSSMEKFALEGLEQVRKWEAERGPYSWFYSRAHFAASHMLGAAYKLDNPSASWTAEFSDPLSRGRENEEQGTKVEPGPIRERLTSGMRQLGLPMPESDNCFVWAEELTYVLADEIIFTNENQLEYMLSYCSNPAVTAMAREKARVSPHPTLPKLFYSMLESQYVLEPDKTHLAYFGVFHPTRGLDDVLTAVATLAPDIRDRLRIHVFTTNPAILEERAAALGVEECVRVGPFARFLEFLNLTTRFDCLVINDTSTGGYHLRNPYLPSKWSDYKGSGTAVWGLVEPDSPLSRQELTYRSPVGDSVEAAKVLEQIVRNAFPRD